jgi:hypothetical protein
LKPKNSDPAKNKRSPERTNGGWKHNMASARQGFGVIGFFLTAVLLSAVGTAVAHQNNTAYGRGALRNNTSGTQDSAFGFDALFNNTDGNYNTASGYDALFNNTNGYSNTATGVGTLFSNTTGFGNTASGIDALFSNTTGSVNTASGASALVNNTVGDENTAIGIGTLFSNTTGSSNTASGVFALGISTTGSSNTAIGYETLGNSSGGSFNIAVGYQAGLNIEHGSNNILIGSLGSGADANTISIGTQRTQNATYIAGISGRAIKGADVVVSSSGQLGIVKSSVRYKKDIQSLNNRSQGLWQLHPVTFRYKQDPQGERQYGLIAEQVAKVYPELVVRGDKGEIESVQYRELIPLMLNEMQRQQAALTALKAQNDVLRATLAQPNAVFSARLERLERASSR